MKRNELIEAWLREEQTAQIHGWDFSPIRGRYSEEKDLPWDYEKIVRAALTPEAVLLDIDTGGGEFLLSLGHPSRQTAATEAYPPNVQLCREKLLPLGIDFHEADGDGKLPFSDHRFDLVINRHGNYLPQEIYRVLKPDGRFITEQVGAENDRELVSLLLPETPPLPFPEQYLEIASEKFRNYGFSILKGQEAHRPIRFWDVGALVWFAQIIPWEFPGFSVEGCLENLFRAQALLEENGVIEGTIHRFLLVAQKI